MKFRTKPKIIKAMKRLFSTNPKFNFFFGDRRKYLPTVHFAAAMIAAFQPSVTLHRKRNICDY